MKKEVEKLKVDGFGDHKNTGKARIDGDSRAPLDMGKGSNKRRIVACPKCGKPVSVKLNCRGMNCSSFGCNYWFDPKECKDFEGIMITFDAPYTPKLSKDYMDYRKKSDIAAESWKNGSKKKYF